MKQAERKELRAKAVEAYCNRQFGCDSISIIKAYEVETRKPVTVFEFHHEFATFTDVRVHANEMVQNIEHNGHRSTMEKFIKEFIAEEKAGFKAELKAKKEAFKIKRQKQKEQKNSLGNLCPELMNLKFA